MEVKVTAASDSDLQGAKKMLKPLSDLFPRMLRLWGDSHYRGTLIEWVKEHLGWNVQVVQGLGTVPHATTQPPKVRDGEIKGSLQGSSETMGH